MLPAYNVMDLGVMETTSETTAEVTSEAEAGTALDETDKHDTSERDSNSHVGESEEVEEEQCEDSATWSTEVTATWQTFLDCSFFTENRKYCKQYEEATVHCPKVLRIMLKLPIGNITACSLMLLARRAKSNLVQSSKLHESVGPAWTLQRL